MIINSVPEAYLENPKHKPDLFAYDFKMTDEAIKSKVDLTMHMFSFLQKGKKQVHVANNSILVDNTQSLLIKKGNCLWTELLDKEEVYNCKLLFFTSSKLKKFLEKYGKLHESELEKSTCFIIENDIYIKTYLDSLSTMLSGPKEVLDNLLTLKYEELMLYLLNKYSFRFEQFLNNLLPKETSSFEKIVENNCYSSLSIEELAFLCNMSLSTFKRHFNRVYKVSPGKWLRDKRLEKAMGLLLEKKKPSDIYFDLGYANLSNFSIAFKAKYGINPTEI